MPSIKESLENLVLVGMLKREPPRQDEFDGMFALAKTRLGDSRVEALSPESRFELAYGAAHGFSLAALRWHGYRPENRFVVFQALQHTLGLDQKIWRIFSKCHDRRNLADYEGYFEVDEQLLEELIEKTDILALAVEKLGPVFEK